MRRRECILLLGGTAIGWPFGASAQATGPARIGYLTTDSLENPLSNTGFNAFRQGLRDLGHVEGQTVTIELREAGGSFTRFPELVNELLRLPVDVIVVPNTPAARVAQQATAVIPIVVVAMGDPVRDGLIASLARPGANITGLTFLGPELMPKRLALLKEMLPTLSRVAGLWHPDAYGEHTTSSMFNEAALVADSLGLQLQVVQVHSRDELDGAFAATTAQALIQFPSPMFYAARQLIVDLAARYRLPAIFVDRAFVEIGGLMGYGASIIDLFRGAAKYVDKILKGAKPSELPVEQPTKFVLAINLQTARTLDLIVPPALLARADEVIE